MPTMTDNTSSELRPIGQTDTYNFRLVGSYGSFTSNSSYPIAFFQTSVPIQEAVASLTFARDLHERELNFDLLMQRDIDEARVEHEIIPYLKQAVVDHKTRPLFFPPLLVALVPTNGDMIEDFYPQSEMFQDEEKNQIGVKWGSFMKLTGFTGHENELGQLPLPIQGSESQKLQITQCRLDLKKSVNKHDCGIRLVVIDGQHRLMALKKIYEENSELLENLVLPISVLFPPLSCSSSAEESSRVERGIPTVPQVFRTLFVDVNSTMKEVGGHFTILLSEKTASQLTCRALCAHILTGEEGKQKLRQLEWNTRSKKDSSQVKNTHSVTSIGIIDDALTEFFKKGLFPYLTGIRDHAWNSSTLAGSTSAVDSLKEKLVPKIYQLFFCKEPFRALSDKIATAEANVRQKAYQANNQAEWEAFEEKFYNYIPINPGDAALRRLEDNLDKELKENQFGFTEDFIRKARFQTALFQALYEIASATHKNNLDPTKSWQVLFALMEKFYTNSDGQVDGIERVFARQNQYMQHSVYKQDRFIANKRTANVIRDVILSNFANSNMLDHICNNLEQDRGETDIVPPSRVEAIRKDFEKIGTKHAGLFLKFLHEQKSKDLKSNFAVTTELPQDQVQRLTQLQQALSQGGDNIDEKREEFDNIIEKEVTTWMKQAATQYQKKLAINQEIVEPVVGNAEDPADDTDE